MRLLLLFAFGGDGFVFATSSLLKFAATLDQVLP